jgi:HEAT repeat protein
MHSMPHTARAGKKLLLRRFALLLATAAVLSAPSVGRGADKPTVSDWVEKLKDKHKEVRLWATKALGDMGTLAKAIIPDLMEGLKDKDLEVQQQAARALAQIGPSSVPALQEALKDEQVHVRMLAAEALGILAPDAKEAVAALLEAAKDRHAAVRAVALEGLLAEEGDRSEVESAFQEAAKDPNPYLSLLGNMGVDQIKAKADGKGPRAPVNFIPVLAVQRLTPAQEAQLDQMVEIFLAYHSHDMKVLEQLPVPMPVAAQIEQCVKSVGPEGIPSLVRGVNKADSLGFSCAAGVLCLSLQWAIANCSDPQQLDYAQQNIGRGVPVKQATMNADSYRLIRDLSLQRKSQLLLLTLAEEKQAEFNRLVEKFTGFGDADLKDAFKDKAADLRLLTTAALRRLHCEDDLIAALADPDPRVGQLARQSLMRLSRGTDFGPAADAGDAARKAAQKRWREWWGRQDQNPNADTTKTDPPAGAASPGEDLAAAAKLADELAAADAAGRAKPLATLCEGKGVAYTDALAVGIGQLQGEARDQARAALEDRLAKLPVGALRERLLDADAELRRAAAAAAGQKMDREFAPELIHLLSDDDAAAAARAALRALSGEDFGPADGADK